MKTNKTYIALAGISLVALVAGGVVFASKSSVPTAPAQPQTAQSDTITLTVQGLYTNIPVKIRTDETVLQVLQTLNSSDPQVSLSTKTYSGLGILVDGMHGVKNGTDKKYWQYKVNGVLPQIGADSYKLKDGDTVEWFFSASQE